MYTYVYQKFLNALISASVKPCYKLGHSFPQQPCHNSIWHSKSVQSVILLSSLTDEWKIVSPKMLSKLPWSQCILEDASMVLILEVRYGGNLVHCCLFKCSPYNKQRLSGLKCWSFFSKISITGKYLKVSHKGL